MLPNTPSFPLHYTVRERTQSPPHHHPVSTRGIYSPSPHHSLSGEGGYVDQRINHAHSPSPATKPLHACSSFITHTVSVSPIPFRCIFVAPHPPHVTNANHTHPHPPQAFPRFNCKSHDLHPKSPPNYQALCTYMKSHAPPKPVLAPAHASNKSAYLRAQRENARAICGNLNRRVTVQRHVKFRQAGQAFLLNEMRRAGAATRI